MSSINGVNTPSFRALSQGFTRNLQSRVDQRTSSTGAVGNANASQTTTTTPPTVNERNLGRATRDLDIIMRSVGRESQNHTERAGSNTAVADQITQATSEFEKAMQGRFDAFVEGGAQDYLGFAEETAVARRNFRTQLRDISNGAVQTTRPSTTTSLAVEASKIESPESSSGGGRTTTPTTTTTTPNTGATSPTTTSRAQRDLDSLVGGLDREFERLTATFGGNAEAMDKLTSLRSAFIDSAKAEFESLAQGSTASYSDFAQRVAAMRQQLGRDLRSTAEGLSPAAPTTTMTTTATPVSRKSTEVADAPVQPTTTNEPAGVTPNERNIGRAKRDAEILLRGLDRESTRFADAMGDTPEARQVRAQADNFRSMLEERLSKFIEEGGSDYLGFAEEMATARRGLSGNFARLAGPKFDRFG